MKGKQTASHIDSFYHLARMGQEEQLCQGTACFVARQLNPDRWSSAVSGQERVYCLGNCFAAPASSRDFVRPKMRILSREPIVLGPIIDGPISSLAASTARGGYRALDQALGRPRAELVSAVERFRAARARRRRISDWKEVARGCRTERVRKVCSCKRRRGRSRSLH